MTSGNTALYMCINTAWHTNYYYESFVYNNVRTIRYYSPDKLQHIYNVT
jgi:hypothetical protein